MPTAAPATNDVEAWKRQKHGFDVWSDLEAHARRATPLDAIPYADIQRLKWYGIFAARHRDAPDARYMLRVRVPACELTASQARASAQVARRGSGPLEITRQGDLQVRGLRLGDLPPAIARLESEGLTGRQTGHDNIRNIPTHLLAGLDPGELLDARPLCRALTDVFLGDRLLSDLPRRITASVDGRETPCASCWNQDLSFVAARAPDGTPGFRWLLATSHAPPLWFAEPDIPDLFRQTMHLYRDQTCRANRSRARLRDFIAQCGLHPFLNQLQDRLATPFRPLPGPPPTRATPCRHHGWIAQKQPDLWSLAIAVPPETLTPRLLTGLADLAETFGDGTLRTTFGATFVLPAIPDHRRTPTLQALDRLASQPPPLLRQDPNLQVQDLRPSTSHLQPQRSVAEVISPAGQGKPPIDERLDQRPHHEHLQPDRPRRVEVHSPREPLVTTPQLHPTPPGPQGQGISPHARPLPPKRQRQRGPHVEPHPGLDQTISRRLETP